MPRRVQFHEPTGSRSITKNTQPLLIRWVLKIGIVQEKTHAVYVLLAAAVGIAIVALVLFVNATNGNDVPPAPVPPEQIPSDPRSR